VKTKLSARRGPRALAAAASAAIVLVGLAGLAGCSEDSDEVATLETKGANASDGASPASEQRSGAEALHACLDNAGIPAQITAQDNGDAFVWVGDENNEIVVVATTPDGGSSFSGPEDTNYEEYNDFITEHEGEYAILVDGVDKSDPYAACYESSGYVEPVYESDPAQELKMKQGMADSTNVWIACARENGFPNLKDVTAEVDTDSFPQAELPFDTTEEALRDLIAACPVFDEERALRQLDPEYVFDPDTYETDPVITFEGAEDFWTNLSEEASTSPDAERLNRLSEILFEPMTTFWEEHQGDLAGGGSVVLDGGEAEAVEE